MSDRFLSEEEQKEALKILEVQLRGVQYRLHPMVYTGKDGKQVSDVAFLEVNGFQIVHAIRDAGYDIWNYNSTRLLNTGLTVKDVIKKIILKPHVGASPTHTPIKHALYNRTFGRIVGAASQMGLNVTLIDACSGDGRDTLFSGTCSPSIALKHLQWAQKQGMTAAGYLIERDANTVAQLRQRIANPLVTIIHGDYRTAEVADLIGPMDSDTTAFLYIDPNHANDVELSPHLRELLPELTTMLITLGCNANGIKRLPLEERWKWFERVEYLLQLKRPYHEACLVRLERDSHQWAYLLTAPQKWRDRVTKDIDALGKLLWQKGVASHWLSDGEKEFWAAAKRLFLKVDGSEESPR